METKTCDVKYLESQRIEPFLVFNLLLVGEPIKEHPLFTLRPKSIFHHDEQENQNTKSKHETWNSVEEPRHILLLCIED
jgi:hypothetical protein